MSLAADIKSGLLARLAKRITAEGFEVTSDTLFEWSESSEAPVVVTKGKKAAATAKAAVAVKAPLKGAAAKKQAKAPVVEDNDAKEEVEEPKPKVTNGRGKPPQKAVPVAGGKGVKAPVASKAKQPESKSSSEDSDPSEPAKTNKKPLDLGRPTKKDAPPKKLGRPPKVATNGGESMSGEPRTNLDGDDEELVTTNFNDSGSLQIHADTNAVIDISDPLKKVIIGKFAEGETQLQEMTDEELQKLEQHSLPYKFSPQPVKPASAPAKEEKETKTPSAASKDEAKAPAKEEKEIKKDEASKATATTSKKESDEESESSEDKAKIPEPAKTKAVKAPVDTAAPKATKASVDTKATKAPPPSKKPTTSAKGPVDEESEDSSDSDSDDKEKNKAPLPPVKKAPAAPPKGKAPAAKKKDDEEEESSEDSGSDED